jgi:hypothetical protein
MTTENQLRALHVFDALFYLTAIAIGLAIAYGAAVGVTSVLDLVDFGEALR